LGNFISQLSRPFFFFFFLIEKNIAGCLSC